MSVTSLPPTTTHTLPNGTNGANGLEHIVNGTNGVVENGISPPEIAAVGGPGDVKIDMDYTGPESDARHEPHPMKMHEDVSVPVAVETTVESAPVVDATVELEEPAMQDTVMADASGAPVGDVNGSSYPADMDTRPRSQPLAATDDEEDKPPPAKRARMDSDPDEASLAHSASPPPPSAGGTPAPLTANSEALSQPLPADGLSQDAVMAPAPTFPTTNGASSSAYMSHNQFRFCQSTIRSLKKLKDAQLFLRPVDTVALNIPHYNSIIKTPMDFSTVDRKLSASNPLKPDPNPENPRYATVDEFTADVLLIFTNCYTFNGPDHNISQMAKRLQDTFERQMKNLPPPEVPKPPPVKKPSPPPVKKAQPARRASTSVPVIRRSENEAAPSRPKREIHPPAPKDLPYVEAPKKAAAPRKPKRVASKDDGTVEQLKYCQRILADLHRKQYYNAAYAFYEPVDWVKLQIPNYPKVVKKPMDMSTMKRKLEGHEYSTAKKFEEDFRLMLKNCFVFNPEGTPVHISGRELERIFDEKWAGLPPLHAGLPTDDEFEEEEDEEEDEDDHSRQRTIQEIESQIEYMRGNLAALRGKQAKEKKKKKEKPAKPAVASVSKPSAPKPPKPSTSSKKKSKKPLTDDDTLSFEQKKDLSEAITALDPSKLEKVIQIIHEGVPEIRDSTEEIELEIDLLPPAVLTKLYNFVVRPLRAPTVKRTRGGKGTGTGGLKRKSMDEDVEAEKIRQLEERMALFENGGTGAALPALPEGDKSEHSSDSSSDSDSSLSESE